MQWLDGWIITSSGKQHAAYVELPEPPCECLADTVASGNA